MRRFGGGGQLKGEAAPAVFGFVRRRQFHRSSDTTPYLPDG